MSYNNNYNNSYSNSNAMPQQQQQSSFANFGRNITGANNLQRDSGVNNIVHHLSNAKKHTKEFNRSANNYVKQLKSDAHGTFVEARNIYNQYASGSSATTNSAKEAIINGIRHAKKYILSSNDYNHSKKEGTVLVALPVTHTHVSHYVFNDVHPNRCVPLILMPRKNAFRTFAVVPNGVWAIATQFNKIVGTYEDGFHFLPPGRRIKYVVTKGHILFDYPVKTCPTLDNVIVKIDTLLVFCIVDPVKFAFELGPTKLRDLLASFLQESIRSLARTVYYDKVYDLRGHNMNNLVRSLNNRLVEQYGVKAHSLTITEIQIPKELHGSMQKTTSITAYQRCRQKEHEFDIMKLLNTEKLENLKLDHKNERLEVDEEAKRFRNLISKEVDEIESLTKKRLQEVEAEEAHQVYTITQKANKEVGILDAKKDKSLYLARKNAAKKSSVVIANVDAHRIRVEAETRHNTAQNLAKAKEQVANAEEKCSSALIEKRAFKEAMARLDIIQLLPKNGDLVVSGSTDYDQLAQLSAIEYQQPLTPPTIARVQKLKEPINRSKISKKF